MVLAIKSAPPNSRSADGKLDIDELASKLQDWDAQIQTLKARTDLGLAQAEARYYGAIRDLRAREKRIEKMISELDAGDVAVCEQYKEQLARAAEDLREALASAIADSPWCHQADQLEPTLV